MHKRNESFWYIWWIILQHGEELKKRVKLSRIVLSKILFANRWKQKWMKRERKKKWITAGLPRTILWKIRREKKEATKTKINNKLKPPVSISKASPYPKQFNQAQESKLGTLKRGKNKEYMEKFRYLDPFAKYKEFVGQSRKCMRELFGISSCLLILI